MYIQARARTSRARSGASLAVVCGGLFITLALSNHGRSGAIYLALDELVKLPFKGGLGLAHEQEEKPIPERLVADSIHAASLRWGLPQGESSTSLRGLRNQAMRQVLG
jgi:hypothetical protein